MNSPEATNRKSKFRFFRTDQAAVIEDIVSIIIPADDKPGAREAGVVYELDMLVSNSARSQRLYRNGIKWFDAKAASSHNESKFTALPEEAKYDLLKMAESAKQGGKETSEVKSFLDLIKSQTLEVFYTGAAGWKLVGYQGPPQWTGNRKYFKCD